MKTGGPGRILIADDEALLGEALRTFLVSRGYYASVAADGASALSELKAATYDLLLTDLNMPAMSGEELIEEVQALGPDERPAVIVMTGHASMDSAIKGIKAGISAYIRKPLAFHELEAAIGTAIRKHRLEKELKLYYRELDKKVEERTRGLSLINSFSEIVNRSFDLEAILDDAVEHILSSIETDAAWIYLLDGDPPELRLMASKGFSEEFAREVSVIKGEDGYRGLTFKDGGSFRFNGPLPQNLPISTAVATEGFTTAMHAAIKSGDAVLGSMGVASKAGKQFEDPHMQLLISFGNQIGVAIQKVRLYEQEKLISKDLENKVNQLFIMNWMGTRARVSNSLSETAMALVSSIVQAIGFDRVCLWLLDEEEDNLYLAACYGSDGRFGAGPLAVEGARIRLEELQAGEAVITTSNVCNNRPGAGGPDCGEVVMAPLVTHNPDVMDIKCWEHFKCSQYTCKAYKNHNLSCWMIKDSCHKWTLPNVNLLDKMEICKLCPVYRANTKGKTIGVLCADNQATGHGIGPDDIKLLNIFSNSAAAAIENIRLMEKLVKNERFIDSIILNMSSGLLVTDRGGHVRMINYAGAEILGCRMRDIKGRPLAEAFPEAGIMLQVTGPTTLGHEVMITTSRGPVPVGYTNSTLGDKADPEGVIIVFRDLSEIKKLHEQLRERDHFAAIGKVAAGVAHEIRNPLFGITSVAQILAREIKAESSQKALVDAMLSETSRLNTLVEDMLLYGRSMKLSVQQVRLDDLVDNVLLVHKALITEKGILVVKEFEESLPELMLDPGQMRQVFLNILVNALDASGPGGVISFRASRSEDGAVIRITDTGLGIPEDDISKVFDLFYTTKEKGTGLGLAICRKIVEDHGGVVALESSLGKGTSVEIRLPCGEGRREGDRA